MDETGIGQAPDPCIHENDGAAPCGRIFSTFDAGIGPRACFAVSISVQQNFFPHFWPSCAFAQIKIGALQSSILQRSYFLFVRGSALGGLLSAALQEGLGAGPWARCQICCLRSLRPPLDDHAVWICLYRRSVFPHGLCQAARVPHPHLVQEGDGDLIAGVVMDKAQFLLDAL